MAIAPPAQASLCQRKHLRQRGAASRNNTRRLASSMSVWEGLWHTNTSYFRSHLSSELRAVFLCCGFEGAVPGDNEECSGDADEEDEILLTELSAIFSLSSCCADKAPLDFKSFWNQLEEKREQTGSEQSC